MKRNVALALLSLLCVLSFAAVGSYAWLSKTQAPEEKIYTALSDFELVGTLSFVGKDGNPYTYVSSGEVLVPIGLTEGSTNYIGSMKYDITYRGVSPAYIRVRVIEQWLDRSTGEIKSMPYMSYHITGAVSTDKTSGSTISVASSSSSELAVQGVWVDNRSADFSYYYSVPVQPKSLAATGEQNNATLSDGAVTITLIDQRSSTDRPNPMPDGVNPATTDLSLLIQVEAVQPNRFREFWNIDAIPQPASNP